MLCRKWIQLIHAAYQGRCVARICSCLDQTFSFCLSMTDLYINEAYLEMYTDDTIVHYADKDKNMVEL